MMEAAGKTDATVLLSQGLDAAVRDGVVLIPFGHLPPFAESRVVVSNRPPLTGSCLAWPICPLQDHELVSGPTTPVLPGQRRARGGQ